MPLFPLPVGDFGGFNLVDAVDEVAFSGAIDLLNVDLDQPGRVRSRDGYSRVNAVAAPANLAGRMYAMNGASSTRLLVSSSTDMYSYSPSTLSGTGAGLGDIFDAQAIGTGSAGPYAYLANSSFVMRRFDSATNTFSTPAGLPSASSLTLQPTDNRLVAVDQSTGSGNKVKFSDAGAPETWGANNYVELSPNDGDVVIGLATWRDLVFAFKKHRFYVFYGNSTDSSGNPIFNYRPVNVGIGAEGNKLKAMAVAPEGLYFWSDSGIYLTTGSAPVKVSSALDPLFQTATVSSFVGTAISPPMLPLGMAYHNNRLYAVIGNLRLVLVYTPATNTWLLWQPVTAFKSLATGLSSSGFPTLFCTSNNTTAFIYKFDPTVTTDDGTAITSYYQSGFDNLAPPRRFAAHYLFGNTRKRIRKWKLTGTGTVAFNVAHDFAAMPAASSQNVTLGVSPAVKDGWYQVAKRGQKFSFRIADVSGAPWSVQSLTSYLAGSEPPLLGNPSDT